MRSDGGLLHTREGCRVVSGQDDKEREMAGGRGQVGLGRRVLAHELRTPLSAIATVAELLLDTHAAASLSPEQYRQYISDVQTSALHALAVVDATLGDGQAAARGDVMLGLAGALAVEPVSLGDLAAGVVSVMVPLCHSRGVAIRLSINKHDAGDDQDIGSRNTAAVDGAPVMAIADARAVRQMLFNLVSNALRFTPDGGLILVEVTTVPGDAGEAYVPQVSVTDTGGGIGSPEREDHATGGADARPIGKDQTNKLAVAGGSGLGFRVVRALAYGIGASLSIESAAGSGTRAVVRFRPETRANGVPARQSWVRS